MKLSDFIARLDEKVVVEPDKEIDGMRKKIARKKANFERLNIKDPEQQKRFKKAHDQREYELYNLEKSFLKKGEEVTDYIYFDKERNTFVVKSPIIRYGHHRYKEYLKATSAADTDEKKYCFKNFTKFLGRIKERLEKISSIMVDNPKRWEKAFTKALTTYEYKPGKVKIQLITPEELKQDMHDITQAIKIGNFSNIILRNSEEYPLIVKSRKELDQKMEKTISQMERAKKGEIVNVDWRD